MIALRYGTVPVVRSTGGLADTVKDVDNYQVGGCRARWQAAHESTGGRPTTDITTSLLCTPVEPSQSFLDRPEQGKSLSVEAPRSAQRLLPPACCREATCSPTGMCSTASTPAPSIRVRPCPLAAAVLQAAALLAGGGAHTRSSAIRRHVPASRAVLAPLCLVAFAASDCAPPGGGPCGCAGALPLCLHCWRGPLCFPTWAPPFCRRLARPPVYAALDRAIQRFKEQPEWWEQLRGRIMADAERWSWNTAAGSYVDIYRQVSQL